MDSLRDVLLRHGFSFKKQFGQNFLSDANLLDSIVAAAGVDERTTALEIGCGAGTLTRALAKRAKRVIAYEIDVKLRPVLEETLAGVDNAEVVFRDFLREDLSALEAELPPYTVVANLPYYITTPLVTKFIDGARKAQAQAKNVLPVPVWAVASTSCPFKAGGKAACCTGVGSVMPKRKSAWRKSCGKASKALILVPLCRT